MSAFHDNDAYELATLAAQLMCRQKSVPDAIETAWNLVEGAACKLEHVKLKAKSESPEAEAEWEKQQAERLESLKIPFVPGIKIITSQDRLDYARKWFKRFLEAKAEKERKPQEREAWVEAKIATYEQRGGFTGTEAQKLKEEFDQWRGKGKQGRVLKPATDGRLRENRQKKKEQEAKEAWSKFNKPKLRFREAVRPFINRGRKTPICVPDTPNSKDTF